MDRQRLLIVGFGYFGRFLARILDRDRYEIYGTTRFAESFQGLLDQDVIPIQLDVVNPQHSDLGGMQFDTIVYCVGFDRNGQSSKQTVYVDGLRRFLNQIQAPSRNFVYVSSTGVYGQKFGEWVTETSETSPSGESGRICLQAEEALLAAELNCPVTILRFAGIYGPNRVPNLNRLKGTTEPDTLMPVAQNSFLNLIHVADAAAISRCLMESSADKQEVEFFNVADGNPVDRRDFYTEVARQSGVGLPRFRVPVSAELGVGRGSTSKKVSNRKLVAHTRYQFLFPSYQQGLIEALKPQND
ncbi:NAD-dependent epimerase/dehydratase family protein [Pirellulaceae bacterium]|nr:NAD-dependent epimerase/dehydratase family protein [Pirellulaceae bacterium]